MTIPSEINAVRYYELEIKARGFDILQELEVLNERVSILKNEKIKVIRDLQLLYKKTQETSEEPKASEEIKPIDPVVATESWNDDKKRVIKSVHEVGKKK